MGLLMSLREYSAKLLGAWDGIITVLVEDPAFGLLGGAELFGQRIALGYENVRINAAAFSQSGQQLILTGKFRYLFVQLNDVHTPEEFPFTDGLEVGDEVGQDVVALVLEIVIQPEEGLLDLDFGDRRQRTRTLIYIVRHTTPVSVSFLLFSPKCTSTLTTTQLFCKWESAFLLRLCVLRFFCFKKCLYFLKIMFRDNCRMCASHVILCSLSFIPMPLYRKWACRVRFLQHSIAHIAFICEDVRNGTFVP